MTSLPDKPSELIRLALKDLKACENDPRYVIGMEYWHRAEGDVCVVCLAGSVIAQSLKVSPLETSSPLAFEAEIDKKLLALNALRNGGLWVAFYILLGEYCSFPGSLPECIYVVPYEDSPEQFHIEMNAMADLLEKEGY